MYEAENIEIGGIAGALNLGDGDGSPAPAVPSETPISPATPTEPGNGSGAPSPEAPAAPEAPVAPAPENPGESKLYKTPDGREVDAETLSREWKEHWMPEYTRKSQALAELTKNNQTPAEQPQPKAPAYGEDWAPSSYGEIVEVAKKEAMAAILEQQRQEAERQSAAQQIVESQLAEIKATDPQLDEGRLFQHANKYQFADLKLAYQNMKEMAQVAASVEKKVTENITKRAQEPVAGKSTGTPAPSGIDWGRAQANRNVSALEYLKNLGS